MEKSTQQSTDNTVSVVPWDLTACAHYRLVQEAQMLQSIGRNVILMPKKGLRQVGQNVIFTQRICTSSIMEPLIKFKEATCCKIVIDYDDLIWNWNGDTIPDYNSAIDRIDTDKITSDMKELLSRCADLIIVSTEQLKKSMIQFIPEERIWVIPNMLTFREWYFPRSNSGSHLNTSFFFAGSQSHFNNEKKLLGDFSKGIVNYLSNKTVTVKGTEPFCISPSMILKSSPLTRYAADLYRETRDSKFIIAPLADNVFNTCKSHLKYLESAAVGRVCLVSSFENGPYEEAHPYQKIPVDATAKTIEFIVKRAEEHYDEILKYQYSYLDSYWLDNNIELYGKILGI